MGRIEIYHKDKGLAFGRDHALGEFLQIWDLSKGQMPDADNILVDEDALTGLTRVRMEQLILQHGFTLEELEKAFLSSRGGL